MVFEETEHVEMATFGSEFVALWIYKEMIVAL
jgi:hypothetical protein